MKTTNTRKLISAMQISLDGFIEDDNGTTDWVDSWADAIQLIENVDMFLLGGSMQPGYGEYWGSIYDNPQKVPLSNPELPSQQGRLPTESEIAYARLAAKTPHIVLSRKLKDISWPQSQIVRDIDEVRKLKSTPGNNIYVVGGSGLVSSLMDAHLVDELRLIVHPIIIGSGKPLFNNTQRHRLELVEVKKAESDRVILTYRAQNNFVYSKPT